MHQKLIRLITQNTTLTEKEIELIKTLFNPISVSKGHVLEASGKIPRHLYFIVTGIVRQYKIDAEGNEITTHLNCPPGFITPYFSFIKQQVSVETTVCLTDCELLQITHQNLERLTNGSVVLKQFNEQTLAAALAYNEQRALELSSLTAIERYQKLFREQPDLVKYVPVNYLASFLGIHPESLSRIRRQITS